MIKMRYSIGLFFVLIAALGVSQNKIISKSLVDVTTTKAYQQKPERLNYVNEVNTFELYYTSDALKIHGFIIEPKKEGKYPVIVYCRGGNRSFGEITLPKTILLNKLAAQGYVIVLSNYRGSSKSEGEDEFGGRDVNDVVALFDLIPEIEKADNSKIALMGGSRGGMMVYQTLRRLKENKNIKTAVVMAGATDLELTFKNRPKMETMVRGLIPDNDNEQAIKDRSVIKWTDELPTHVPLLILHGDMDTRVDIEHARILDNKLNAINFPHKLVVYENGEHSLFGHRELVNAERINWFKEYLK